MRKIITPMLAVAAALAIAAPAASAHVTAQPPEQPAGGFTVLNIRVPNERPEATEKVEIQFPEGITSPFPAGPPPSRWRSSTSRSTTDTAAR